MGTLPPGLPLSRGAHSISSGHYCLAFPVPICSWALPPGKSRVTFDPRELALLADFIVFTVCQHFAALELKEAICQVPGT